MIKVCSNCGQKSNISCFPKNKSSKDGFYSICKPCKQYKNKTWKLNNTEQERNNNALYFQRNKLSILSKRQKYRANNINYRLACNLRGRLGKAIKNNHKAGSAIGDLGCSIEDLKKHLESQFKPGMNWNNYGLKGWHLDHIKPLSKFNLENKEEFKEACNYKNLQPLWAEDNLRKNKHFYGIMNIIGD